MADSTIDNSKKQIVDRYLSLSSELGKIKESLDPEIKRLVEIYSKLNNDTFKYVENWHMSYGCIYIETVGYRFGEVTNYYRVPVGYLYDDKAHEKVELDVNLLKQRR